MKFRCWIGVAVTLAACGAALAQETLKDNVISRPIDDRMAIAVPPFATAPGMESLGESMAYMVSYDLLFSGEFNVMSASSYPAEFTGFTRDARQIDFAAWREAGAEFLIHVYIYKKDGAYVSEFRLFDLLAAQEIARMALHPKRPDWLRLMFHRFSEEVVRVLTGTPGIASTSICFSGGSTGDKEIYMADYDGANVLQVTKHGSISILPKFSPDGRKIAYMSFKDRYPFLYVLDLSTGKSSPLSKSVGLNVAPAWSPDGSKLAIALSKDANPEIYIVNPDGTNPQRLTNDRAVDSSPTFSPDGGRIAFVSERTGSAQVFAMSATGGNQKRLSFQGGRSYDPAWSPDGKAIAYVVERRGEGLELYVMDADGQNPRRVTDSTGSNEAPSWSPDSRHVIFASTRSGRSELWTVNATTLECRRVPQLNLRCQGPDWGPRRK
ncbi:MAG: Tol-Pal system beta propeller repeat protein TolB [bacterium]|nr:Tol-Pal system beta propeller repeat protein TolB [bacterium]